MTSAVDALSGAIVLLVAVYVLQRGFAPSDAEFLLLTAVLLLVLSCTCLATPVAHGGLRGGGCPSARECAEGVGTAGRAFLEGYVNDLFELPGKVRDILEPKVEGISRGFKGEATNVFTFVGDGKQERYDRARAASDGGEGEGEGEGEEGERAWAGSHVGFRAADFYQDPGLQRSDAEFRDAKAAWEARMEARRMEMERRSQERQIASERAMPEMVRSLLERQRKEQDRARREGGGHGTEQKVASSSSSAGAAAGAAAGGAAGKGGGGVLNEMVDIARASVAERNKVNEEVDAAAAAAERGGAAEENRPLTDENGIPLRFDPVRFKAMVDGMRRSDYALCRIKSRDYDVYKALLDLGWLRTYQAERRIRARGPPPASCRA